MFYVLSTRFDKFSFGLIVDKVECCQIHIHTHNFRFSKKSLYFCRESIMSGVNIKQCFALSWRFIKGRVARGWGGCRGNVLLKTNIQNVPPRSETMASGNSAPLLRPTNAQHSLCRVLLETTSHCYCYCV